MSIGSLILAVYLLGVPLAAWWSWRSLTAEQKLTVIPTTMGNVRPGLATALIGGLAWPLTVPLHTVWIARGRPEGKRPVKRRRRR